MEPELIKHLKRIAVICDAMTRHDAWREDALTGRYYDYMAAFDQDYWTFTHYLSLQLYRETSGLLQDTALQIRRLPRIGIVVAVHEPDPVLLKRSLVSACRQVGVDTHVYLSLDGLAGKRHTVECILAEIKAPTGMITILSHPENRGVGLCRNAALKQLSEEWFTFLDCDDIFHPLRLLHGWLAARSLNVEWLTTGCSRVSIEKRKIYLVQQCLSATGYNSFLANRTVLRDYGYFANLRYWEDSEYMNRLRHFGASMNSCTAVGHYANTEISRTKPSLGSRWRTEAHEVVGHPYLCGTIMAEIDDETKKLRDQYTELYKSLDRKNLAATFPPEGGIIY